MALDSNLGSALTNLLAKRKSSLKGAMPTDADSSTLAGLGGMPTANPNWKPPPGAMGAVAPPVGATTGQNQAASQAQNPAQPVRPVRRPQTQPQTQGSVNPRTGKTNPWEPGSAQWRSWEKLYGPR
jgi:hypothetical protein